MLVTVTNFADKINHDLSKQSINTLQINLGKICNLACNHCHVEASPYRTEEMSAEICEQLITIIERFPQIKTVDLTGGAPEMNYGFHPLVEVSRSLNKEIIVRSNLTIYFLDGFQYLPSYCAENQIRIVASLPCYLENNVDKMRGKGVYNDSIQAIQLLNELGYAKDPNLILDLVYNPALPHNHNFSLSPDQVKLEQDYKKYLKENFHVEFNHLLTITNLPIGRTKFYLKNRHLYQPYLEFLEQNFNRVTIDNLMCRSELSIDYLGNVYDCDFHQMENIPARLANGEKLTVAKLLELNSLDVIPQVQTANHCYACTAGSGSSCGGALV